MDQTKHKPRSANQSLQTGFAKQTLRTLVWSDAPSKTTATGQHPNNYAACPYMETTVKFRNPKGNQMIGKSSIWHSLPCFYSFLLYVSNFLKECFKMKKKNSDILIVNACLGSEVLVLWRDCTNRPHRLVKLPGRSSQAGAGGETL